MTTTILVVAEARAGELRPITAELVGAARTLAAGGGQVSLLVVGAQTDALVAASSSLGADEIVVVPAPRDEFEANLWQRAVESVSAEIQPDVLLTGYTVDAMGFAPAVAAQLAAGFASDVTAITSTAPLRVKRGAYSDKLVADIAFDGKSSVLLMLRSGSFAPATAAGTAAVRTVEVSFEGVRAAEHLGFVEARSDGVDITKSEFLLSVGRGIQDEDNVARFAALADSLGATLSVSRPLVDAGWVDASRQVGQSGKTVKPRVYLALGISGAVQHLAGIREAETIIAVNSDPEAPIFSAAHYGVVADLFDIADALEASDA